MLIQLSLITPESAEYDTADTSEGVLSGPPNSRTIYIDTDEILSMYQDGSTSECIAFKNGSYINQLPIGIIAAIHGVLEAERRLLIFEQDMKERLAGLKSAANAHAANIAALMQLMHKPTVNSPTVPQPPTRLVKSRNGEPPKQIAPPLQRRPTGNRRLPKQGNPTW